MKPTILLFDVSRPGFSELVAAVSRRGFTPVLTHPELGRAAGVEHLRWSDFVPADVRETAERELHRVATGLDVALGDPHVRAGFASRWGDTLELNGEVLPTLLRLLAGEIVAIETLDALIRETDLRGIALGCDNGPVQRAVIGRARVAKIPTLQIAHGIARANIELVAGESHRVYADRVAVFGERARDILVELGNDPDRIVRVGAPLLDASYRDRIAGDPRAALERGRVLLYCATYTAGGCPLYAHDFRLCLEVQEQLFRAVAQLPEEIELLVKPHPHELARAERDGVSRAELERGYDRWLASRDLPRARLVFERGRDALRAADLVVVSNDSSVALDAMVLGRPVISVGGVGLEKSFAREDGVPYLCGAQIAAELRRWLFDDRARERLLARQKRALPALNHGDDGRATERLAQAIAELASAGRAQSSAQSS